MKKRTIRMFVPVFVLLFLGVGYTLNNGLGTLSAIGWKDISLLCPLGALGTMIAAKTLIPKAVLSLVFAIVAVIVFGCAFCAWICPVPLVSKLRGIFSKKKKEAQGGEDNGACDEKLVAKRVRERGDAFRTNSIDKPSNSRFLVLIGALVSTAVFGFPVFCLICPIGLAFAFIFALMALFGLGDVTWSVVLIPVILLVEVVFFRKWCSHICPLSAFMSLVARLNKSFVPTVDARTCISHRGGSCARCAESCPQVIDPHGTRADPAAMANCTKCRICVDECPVHAITMPALPDRRKAVSAEDKQNSKEI